MTDVDWSRMGYWSWSDLAEVRARLAAETAAVAERARSSTHSPKSMATA